MSRQLSLTRIPAIQQKNRWISTTYRDDEVENFVGMLLPMLALPKDMRTAWDLQQSARKVESKRIQPNLLNRIGDTNELSSPTDKKLPVVGSLPLAMIKVKGPAGKEVTVPAMADSGASATIISYELVEKHDLLISSPNSRSKVKVANGETMETKGITRLEINWFGLNIVANAIVVPRLQKSMVYLGFREMIRLGLLDRKFPVPPESPLYDNAPVNKLLETKDVFQAILDTTLVSVDDIDWGDEVNAALDDNGNQELLQGLTYPNPHEGV